MSVEIGQCLVCGGRGHCGTAEACGRCDGTGEDPARHAGWYLDICAPVQIAAQVDALLKS